MADRWDNVDILRLDRWRQETYHGGPLQGVNDRLLMERLTGSYVHDRQQADGFNQELRIASNLGLLTFDALPGPAGQRRPDRVCAGHLELRADRHGQDRARGRVVAQPPPDPADDDGRMLSDLILPQIAEAITAQYAPDEAAEFPAEEGIPPAQLTLPDGTAEGDAHAVLAPTRCSQPDRAPAG